MASEQIVSCTRLPRRGDGGPDDRRATTGLGFCLAPSGAMDRSFVVQWIGAASARKTLNFVSTFLGELHNSLAFEVNGLLVTFDVQPVEEFVGAILRDR